MIFSGKESTTNCTNCNELRVCLGTLSERIWATQGIAFSLQGAESLKGKRAANRPWLEAWALGLGFGCQRPQLQLKC